MASEPGTKNDTNPSIVPSKRKVSEAFPEDSAFCTCEGHTGRDEPLTIFQHKFPGEEYIPAGAVPTHVYQLDVTPGFQSDPGQVTKIVLGTGEEDEVFWFDGFFMLSFHPISTEPFHFSQPAKDYKIDITLLQKTEVEVFQSGKRVKIDLRSLYAKDLEYLNWLHVYFWEHMLKFPGWLRPTFTDKPKHTHGSMRFLFYPRFILGKQSMRTAAII